MTTPTETKIAMLARYLDEDPADFCTATYDENILEGGGGDYLVLDDDEADEACYDYIRESVWAFNADFLAGWMCGGELTAAMIEDLRGDRCESVNDAFLAMIGADFADFALQAIAADGRGHFLAHYDGEELEIGDDLVAFRVN